VIENPPRITTPIVWPTTNAAAAATLKRLVYC